MRKIVLFIFLFSATFSLLSQSQSFSKWSLSAEYGYNQFDGDINQNLTDIFPTSIRDITYGANIEYAMTPVWGLALDYYYFPLRANNVNPPVIVKTDLYTSSINATINFTRWIFPKTKSKVYINGAIGLGFAYYTLNPTDPSTGLPCENQLGPFGMAGTVPVTFSVEYNFSRPLALGLKAHYRVLYQG
jgi:hypothetical protein